MTHESEYPWDYTCIWIFQNSSCGLLVRNTGPFKENKGKMYILDTKAESLKIKEEIFKHVSFL